MKKNQILANSHCIGLARLNGKAREDEWDLDAAVMGRGEEVWDKGRGMWNCVSGIGLGCSKDIVGYSGLSCSKDGQARYNCAKRSQSGKLSQAPNFSVGTQNARKFGNGHDRVLSSDLSAWKCDSQNSHFRVGLSVDSKDEII